jgi:uncharacterized protein (DUF427 family)
MIKERKDQYSLDNSDHWIEAVESPRRVRVVSGGETIADSKRAMLLREAGCLPVYYFSREDVRMDLMVPTKRKTHCPYKGDASCWTVKVGDKLAEDAAWSYSIPPPDCAAIKDHMAFDWNKMDAWYEEDEEIFKHPRDPYKRVDVLQSSRHVRVVVAGEAVAETRRPYILFETGHPTRYYISREDVRMDLMEPSGTISRCPYKGVASYWSVRVGDALLKDAVWCYLDPIPECPKIKGLFCYFNERVDSIYVDDELLPVPLTRYSLQRD